MARTSRISVFVIFFEGPYLLRGEALSQLGAPFFDASCSAKIFPSKTLIFFYYNELNPMLRVFSCHGISLRQEVTEEFGPSEDIYIVFRRAYVETSISNG